MWGGLEVLGRGVLGGRGGATPLPAIGARECSGRGRDHVDREWQKEGKNNFLAQVSYLRYYAVYAHNGGFGLENQYYYRQDMRA